MLYSQKGHAYEGEELEREISRREKITRAIEKAERWGRKRIFDHAKIRELRAQGKSRKEIMLEVGCKQCVITNAMKNVGKNG